ncbi:MAG: hypothetical protein LJE69_20430 [Thiohalocapsa sp.]|jgi:hypothetical protein|uniref:Rap1a/Tai family immunity protein n=1 Tax=Thiohalocapsa sp. TaxID=2497641 RepID=UPI0025D97B1A|nr:Rap1a/Tai family immunity protein [Thiohalocapsa sp.]MCG6943604.1 hypothetical protein [Thiohalocapsa sp.]
MPDCKSAARRACRLAAAALVLMPLSLSAAGPVRGQADGGPTVAQLLAVCARGHAAGDAGVDAAMCEWYAVPCDCAVNRPAGGPRWCMPDDETIEAALPKVLTALRAEPRQSAPAQALVPEVMARLYPCSAASNP